MAEPETAAPVVEGAAVAPKADKRSRVSAENRCPAFDIEQSLKVAEVIKHQGGNNCTPDQLGGFLDYKNTAGGGFAQRVSAAKQFGFIETVQNRYKITARAEQAMSPVYTGDRERSFRDAFLAVPAYKRIYEVHRGQSLPQGLGMQNYFVQNFGIAAGDRAGIAVRVMLQSADQAGFFRAKGGVRTHLIEPVIAEGDVPVDQGGGGGGTGGSGSGNGNAGGTTGKGHATGGGLKVPVNVHPALTGLLTLLPEATGKPWTGRDSFDTAWKSTLNVLYPATDGADEGGES